MTCERCKNKRILSVMGKCSDLTAFSIGNIEKQGEPVPEDINIGGGDYIRFNLCLNCGQLQGDWPIPTTELEYEEEE